jgi:diguanylate cyclase (GGDEF)-like protein
VDEARFTFDAASAVAAQLNGDELVVVSAKSQHPPTQSVRVEDLACATGVLLELRPLLLSSADTACLLSEPSGLVVPIIAERRAWGLLAVGRDAEQAPFGADDLPLAQAFSGILTAGLSQVAHLEQVQRIALADPLTGVGNRRLVEATVEDLLAAQRPFALLMADVNLLKHINDTQGHAAGDEALIGVATVLSDAAKRRPDAVVGRMGGDEFCVVVPDADADSGMAFARAISRRWDEVPHGSSAALGVAVAGPGESLRSLLAAVDAAQYRAKAAGSHEPVLAQPISGGADRRRWRGRMRAEEWLRAGMARMTPGDSAQSRAAAAVTVLAAEAGAQGWVLSVLDAGAAHPIDGGAMAQGLRLAAVVPAPAGEPWLVQARASGVLLAEEPPLAAARGVDRVAVAVVADLMAEVLLSDQGLGEEVALALKSLLAVAVAG